MITLYKKYIQIALLGALTIFIFSSCSENTMDKINGDGSDPLDVPSRVLVTELLTHSAFSIAGGDLTYYASAYMEHEVGTHNQLYNAETRQGEPALKATYNNSWEGAYRNVLKARLVISKCSEGGSEEGNEITLGIGKTMLAYNMAVLTDLFGDVPYFQAGYVDAIGLPIYRQPKVDKQSLIYEDIFKLLDEALVLFDGKDEGALGATTINDMYYEGDASSWKKAVYGLKARYTMRLLAQKTDKQKELNNVKSFVNSSFSSASSELKFDKYDGSAQNNPLYSFVVSRRSLAAGKSLVSKLQERKDPRVKQIFMDTYDRNKSAATPVVDPDNLVLATNGSPTETQGTYSRLITDVCPSAPTILLSYHELLFLKAEAHARLGEVAESETSLKQAIVAGFANLEYSIKDAFRRKKISELPEGFNLSDSVAMVYFAENVKPLFDANPVKEIMNQKYLAFVGANGEVMETYNDYRRLQGLGEGDFIELTNPKNKEGEFPLRYIYGNSDAVANPNIGSIVGDGTYVYKEKVWWAGGQR